MKLKSLVKPTSLILGAFGISVLLPIVNAAVAEISSKDVSQPIAMDGSDASTVVPPIDLSVDVNQDGISDQLLAEMQKNQAIHDALFERYRASAGPNDTFNEAAYEEYSAAALEANRQLEARMPYPDNIRPVLNQFNQVGEQYEEYIQEFGEDTPEALALLTELRQLSDQLHQDAGFSEVVEETQKVYDFLSEG